MCPDTAAPMPYSGGFSVMVFVMNFRVLEEERKNGRIVCNSLQEKYVFSLQKVEGFSTDWRKSVRACVRPKDWQETFQLDNLARVLGLFSCVKKGQN